MSKFAVGQIWNSRGQGQYRIDEIEAHCIRGSCIAEIEAVGSKVAWYPDGRLHGPNGPASEYDLIDELSRAVVDRDRRAVLGDPPRFAEGDVVSRKTGGPLMTVEQTRTDKFVACVWFDADGHVHRDAFAPQTLNKWKLVEAEDPGMTHTLNPAMAPTGIMVSPRPPTVGIMPGARVRKIKGYPVTGTVVATYGLPRSDGDDGYRAVVNIEPQGFQHIYRYDQLEVIGGPEYRLDGRQA